jgi:hypothetical protein
MFPSFVSVHGVLGLAAAALLWAAPSASLFAQSANLFENAGLESGVLAPWFQDETFQGTENWHVTAADSHSGSYSATAVGDRSIRQAFTPVPSGNIRELSFWLREPSVGNGVYGGLAIKFFLPSGHVDYRTQALSPGWEFFNLTNQIPKNQTITGISVFGYSGGNGGEARIYLDDLVLRTGDRPPSIALTRFGEPAIGASSYTPAPGASELGFHTTVAAQAGMSPRTGVLGIDEANSPVISHRSVAATTTFDAVDLTQWEESRFSIDIRVAATSYENDDFLHVYLTDGARLLDVVDWHGSNAANDVLELAAGDGFRAYSSLIPGDWTSATLVIATSSNSSAAAEQYDFDNLRFEGITAVPEPATWHLAAIGAITLLFVRFLWNETKTAR